MSLSPPKDADVEQGGVQSDDPEMNDPQDPNASGLAYSEFDVKEQDRWLPIANG